MSAERAARGARPAGASGGKAPPRRHRPKTTRAKLLEAAAALFAERGYRLVTLDDIGGAVGISGPGVYRHFKSKEGLLGELLVDVSERLLANAKDRANAARDPIEALEALVDFHVDFAVENPALITVQTRELSSLAPEDQHRVRRLQRSYVEFWADAIVRTGRLERREEAMAAAHATFGLLNSTPFSGRLDDQEMRALLRSMALSGLGPSVMAGPTRPTGPTGSAGSSAPNLPTGPARSAGSSAPNLPTGSTVPSGPAGPRGPTPSSAPVRPPADRTSPGPPVRLVEHGPVAEIVVDRPEALNALSSDVFAQLAVLTAEVGRRPEVRAVVISSALERAFSVGADLKERARFSDAEIAAQRPLVRAGFDAVRALAVPVIAAVAGYALGGGFELALSCDLIVADETAELALPETAVGLVPGGGGTQLVARRAGPAVAADLVFTARHVLAAEALKLGLVDRLVPRGAAGSTALELGRVIAGNSPVAVRAAKRAIRLGAGVDLASGLDIEDAAWRTAAASPDRREGIAAFVEKRRPNWPR